MSTKGPSFLYGNTKGSPTRHINFKYAVDFSNKDLERHIREHMKEFNINEPKEYVKQAIEFANNVLILNDSFVDEKGSTHKYSIVSNEFVIVTKEGYVATYYKPTDKELYWY
jgi:pyocin large subunit-like protein